MPLTGSSGDVEAYLNKIPDRAKTTADGICLLTGVTQYALVFGYSDRPFAVVHLGCGAEQSGAVRYDYDLRKILAFWGLPPTG